MRNNYEKHLKSARSAMNRRTGDRSGKRGSRGTGKRNRRFPEGNRTGAESIGKRRPGKGNLESFWKEVSFNFQNLTCLKASRESEPKLARFWFVSAWATEGVVLITGSDWLMVELEAGVGIGLVRPNQRFSTHNVEPKTKTFIKIQPKTQTILKSRPKTKPKSRILALSWVFTGSGRKS